MDIGGTIKALRERQGWSQEELGWRAGTSAANISRIETGKHGPGPDLLDSLAKAFQLKVHQLFALAEGELNLIVAHLPDRSEEMLLQHFRAMSEEHRLLLLQVGASFARLA